MELRQLFARAKPPTTGEITEAIEHLEGDRVLVETDLRALVGQKSDIFLMGTPDKISEHQSRILDAQLDLDRISTQVDALRGKFAEAERREHEASLDAAEKQARAETEKGAAIVKRAAAAIEKLAGDLAEIERITQTVTFANVALVEAGRDPVPGPDQLGRPDAYRAYHPGQHLLRNTRLVGRDGAYLWNRNWSAL